MEKDNKYYSLIENLVTTHHKYHGYEPILEDIIDDVFAHSKSIIETINDESVIKSYIQKIVSVSIITVPKRLNYHNEIKHRNITSIPHISNNEQQIINNEIASPVPKANIEYVDKMINSIGADSIKEETTQTTVSEPEIIEEDNINIEEVEQAEQINENTANFDNEPDSIVELVEQEELNKQEEIENLEEQEEPDNEQFVLNIDEENNNSSEDIETNTETAEPSSELFILNNKEEDSDNISSELEIETENEYEYETIDNVDSIDEFTPLEEENSEITEESDNVLVLNEVEEDTEIHENEEQMFDGMEENQTEDLTEFDIDNIENENENNESIYEDLTDDSIDILEPDELSNTEESSLDIDFENSEITTLDDSTESEATNSDIDLSIDIENNDNYEELTLIEENTDLDSLQEDVPEQNFKPVDYSAFDYTPLENSDTDTSADNDIITKLETLNENKPELHILKIFDLRYKQNSSIAKIAEDLNIEKETVIAALDEIVELI